ncbi:hypothetical protein ACFQRL_01490 [Microbacterium fluvii]|uniref:Uncharacterized protein n=1 Tax=Microbacterium fluvii TaxID=415215 RepID=A0ABW2H9D4_9MICO|nr:hypothetical protein [Microbacterium fluvii]MCU4671261.1 hypothetical protein [Microbacterium fluvii]
MAPGQLTRRSAAIVVAAVGTALTFAFAAWAVVQILWLNPLAAVPGRTYAEIESALAQASETLAPGVVVGVMALGPLFAVGLLIATTLFRRPDPWFTGLLYMGLLTFGAGAYFVASFGPGMALADAFGINGGDYSPWARPLYIASAASLVGLIVLTIVGVARGWSENSPQRRAG